MVVDLQWQIPPETLSLAPTEVHLWRVDSLQWRSHLDALFALLSADEQARAARFRFSKDHDCFVVGRGWLRLILSRYLAIAPQALRFGYGDHGKPFLQNALDAPLQFNLAHSNGLLLYGVTQLGAIGVDIEQVRSTDVSAIAKRFFSPAEYSKIQTQPDTQEQQFFQLWACKEAYLKATGEGLGAIRAVEIERSKQARSQPKLLRNAQPLAQWTLHELSVAPGFAAALAVEGTLQCMTGYQPAMQSFGNEWALL